MFVRRSPFTARSSRFGVLNSCLLRFRCTVFSYVLTAIMSFARQQRSRPALFCLRMEKKVALRRNYCNQKHDLSSASVVTRNGRSALAMRIRTILLNSNRKTLLENCLTSYAATIDEPFLFIVIDNASSDHSRTVIDRFCTELC